jgi:hypothetical protein
MLITGSIWSYYDYAECEINGMRMRFSGGGLEIAVDEDGGFRDWGVSKLVQLGRFSERAREWTRCPRIVFYSSRKWVVYLPLGLPTFLVFVLTIAIWLWPQGAVPGGCSSCGYDLRGNSSGICPECGNPFVADWLSGGPALKSRESMTRDRRIS